MDQDGIRGRGGGKLALQLLPLLIQRDHPLLHLLRWNTCDDRIHQLLVIVFGLGEAAFRVSRAPSASRRTIAALPDNTDPRRKVAVYEDGYHMLLRDLQGETVWRDILQWIGEPARPLPSGADTDAALATLPRG